MMFLCQLGHPFGNEYCDHFAHHFFTYADKNHPKDIRLVSFCEEHASFITEGCGYWNFFPISEEEFIIANVMES